MWEDSHQPHLGGGEHEQGQKLGHQIDSVLVGKGFGCVRSWKVQLVVVKHS